MPYQGEWRGFFELDTANRISRLFSVGSKVVESFHTCLTEGFKSRIVESLRVEVYQPLAKPPAFLGGIGAVGRGGFGDKTAKSRLTAAEGDSATHVPIKPARKTQRTS